MAQLIKIRNSSVTSEAPATLAPGEIALNEEDEILFYRNGVGAVQSFDLTTAGKSWKENKFVITTNYNGTSDTDLTLSSTPASEADIRVSYDGVDQHPDEWSFSGTTWSAGVFIPAYVKKVLIRVFST